MDRLIARAASEIRDGLQVVVSKAYEVATQSAAEVRQAGTWANDEIKQIPSETLAVVKQVALDVGVESVTAMNTSLAQNVPVVQVREGSLLDDALFFTQGAVTLYRVATFTGFL